MSTRTYYRGPDAVVTDDRFVWHTSPMKSFAVPELHNVGLVYTKTAPLRTYAAPMAGGTLVLAAATWAVIDHPVAYVLGFLGLVIPSTTAVISWRGRRRQWELHATYRGRAVVIYAATDERVFGQVARGLRRSMEAARSPAHGYGLAAA